MILSGYYLLYRFPVSATELKNFQNGNELNTMRSWMLLFNCSLNYKKKL